MIITEIVRCPECGRRWLHRPGCGWLAAQFKADPGRDKDQFPPDPPGDPATADEIPQAGIRPEIAPRVRQGSAKGLSGVRHHELERVNGFNGIGWRVRRVRHFFTLSRARAVLFFILIPIFLADYISKHEGPRDPLNHFNHLSPV